MHPSKVYDIWLIHNGINLKICVLQLLRACDGSEPDVWTHQSHQEICGRTCNHPLLHQYLPLVMLTFCIAIVFHAS